MTTPEDESLSRDIRELRHSIDELNGLLRLIFRAEVTEPLPTSKQPKRQKRKSASQKTDQPPTEAPSSPSPGKHF